MKLTDSQIESLILRKTFSQLSKDEKTFVLNHFENEDAYNDTHNFLKQTDLLFEKERILSRNDEARYAELQKAFKAKHQKNNSLLENIKSYIDSYKLHPANYSFSLFTLALTIVIGLNLHIESKKNIAKSNFPIQNQERKLTPQISIEKTSDLSKGSVDRKKKTRKIIRRNISHKTDIAQRITQDLLVLKDSAYPISSMDLDDIVKLTEYDMPGLREGNNLVGINL